jgi:pimeloyl-ACP methyl ester carboxylesterase
MTHRDIAEKIYGQAGQLAAAGEAIQMALTKARDEFPVYWPDRLMTLQTDPGIKQLIFVMHGIRDESTWPAEIKRAIEKLIGDRAAAVKVIPPLYRRFAMLPFLLYWDRQRNVRWFMDQYTQAKAMYPNLETVDFIGHSNGTYILASALQQYPVLNVRNVLFGGSVVPVHYDWGSLILKRRVAGQIWNICADTDWVVAIFPQLFQQVSDWLKISHPQPGLLDIGSAGFRGFRTSIGAEGRLFNVKYISGGHGAAFEPSKVDRLHVIADFVTSDREESLENLKETDSPSTILQYASNESWAIWIVGVGLIAFLGAMAYWAGWWWFGAYAALLFALLTTI